VTVQRDRDSYLAYRISVRFSWDELEKLRDLAEADKVSLSEYVRAAVLNKWHLEGRRT
jgi:hypothetical protein